MMSEVALLGLGTWSTRHADWPAFCSALETGAWADELKLTPDLIPPRERRRAPQLVKMAIEVMDQACTMAAIDPADVAVVFSSAMGDMQITDYMCRALSQEPKLISPTKFHNSVHNAAPGYWSIATKSFRPANAVSAFGYTASMAFLEAAIQAVEEQSPVLLVTEELAAPPPLLDTCPSEIPFAAALLIGPPETAESSLCTIDFRAVPETNAWPAADPRVSLFDSNTNSRLLPLMTALADGRNVDLKLPLSEHLSLALSLR